MKRNASIFTLIGLNSILLLTSCQNTTETQTLPPMYKISEIQYHPEGPEFMLPAEVIEYENNQRSQQRDDAHINPDEVTPQNRILNPADCYKDSPSRHPQ